ncbi:hypothetical protein [Plebeiibacterium marinum]|uniref:Uncharacterized protein n=1 Tax=Plebeiibacterium marinum TaxID=2992111 RepID=A0AAE3MBB4_9BACT|nr:hypothetical protein [Plebeiobacterium marinum]MCW3804327.1 hypothetical protein [Plebeiobacterium marinum]
MRIKSKAKNPYSKPMVNTICIDCNISLIMMTAWQPGDGKPPGPPGQDKKNSAQILDDTSVSNYSSFEDNPFE